MFYNGKMTKIDLYVQVKREKNVVKLHFFHVLTRVFCTIVLRKSEEVKENLTKKTFNVVRGVSRGLSEIGNSPVLFVLYI